MSGNTNPVEWNVVFSLYFSWQYCAVLHWRCDPAEHKLSATDGTAVWCFQKWKYWMLCRYRHQSQNVWALAGTTEQPCSLTRSRYNLATSGTRTMEYINAATLCKNTPIMLPTANLYKVKAFFLRKCATLFTKQMNKCVTLSKINKYFLSSFCVIIWTNKQWSII